MKLLKSVLRALRMLCSLMPGVVSPKQWGARIIAALVLALGLSAVSSWAEEEQYTPTIKAALLASPKISTTVQLKDGRTLSYRELVEMTETQQDLALESVKPSLRARFHEFEVEVINPINSESRMRISIQDAKNAELDKRLAAQDARLAELKEREGALDARSAELDKSIAAKDAEFVRKAEMYVGLAEEFSKGKKSYLIKLSNHEVLPDSLKQRIHALLADKNRQWPTEP